MRFRALKNLPLFVSLVFLSSCQMMPERIQQARLALAAQIQAEPPGDYFIGRRYY